MGGGTIIANGLSIKVQPHQCSLCCGVEATPSSPSPSSSRPDGEGAWFPHSSDVCRSLPLLQQSREDVSLLALQRSTMLPVSSLMLLLHLTKTLLGFFKLLYVNAGVLIIICKYKKKAGNGSELRGKTIL